MFLSSPRSPSPSSSYIRRMMNIMSPTYKHRMAVRKHLRDRLTHGKPVRVDIASRKPEAASHS